MTLKGFMADAYKGKVRSRKLESRRGDVVLSLEDLADRVGGRPKKDDIAALAPDDDTVMSRLLSTVPTAGRMQIIWGYLTSLAAERSHSTLNIPSGNYAGLEMSSGSIRMNDGGDHVGERMSGGRIRLGIAGDYLGQEMQGGIIVSGQSRKYSFRNMKGGFGVILGDAGDYVGLGNSGGRILVKGNAGVRAGWLMRSGRLVVLGDVSDYLGLMMSGGEIRVLGKAGSKAGWQMRGGKIQVGDHGPEAADGVLRI